MQACPFEIDLGSPQLSLRISSIDMITQAQAKTAHTLFLHKQYDFYICTVSIKYYYSEKNGPPLIVFDFKLAQRPEWWHIYLIQLNLHLWPPPYNGYLSITATFSTLVDLSTMGMVTKAHLKLPKQPLHMVWVNQWLRNGVYQTLCNINCKRSQILICTVHHWSLFLFGFFFYQHIVIVLDISLLWKAFSKYKNVVPPQKRCYIAPLFPYKSHLVLCNSHFYLSPRWPL